MPSHQQMSRPSAPPLQDMQNSMRAAIDQGMQTLEAQQGQNGLPMAPADGIAMAQVGH